jgi:fucose permease
MGELLREPWFFGALGAIFLGGATELGMAQWLPAYAETTLKFPTWVSGSALLLFSVAMAISRMMVGSIGHRVNPFLVMAGCCAASVVLFLIGSFESMPYWALSACIAVGFTGSPLWPTLLAVTADRYPAGGASMFGALAAFGNAGGIFMPWLVGWVADLSNLRWGLAVSTLAPLGMLPLIVILMLTGARRRITF